MRIRHNSTMKGETHTTRPRKVLQRLTTRAVERVTPWPSLRKQELAAIYGRPWDELRDTVRDAGVSLPAQRSNLTPDQVKSVWEALGPPEDWTT